MCVHHSGEPQKARWNHLLTDPVEPRPSSVAARLLPVSGARPQALGSCLRVCDCKCARQPLFTPIVVVDAGSHFGQSCAALSDRNRAVLLDISHSNPDCHVRVRKSPLCFALTVASLASFRLLAHFVELELGYRKKKSTPLNWYLQIWVLGRTSWLLCCSLSLSLCSLLFKCFQSLQTCTRASSPTLPPSSGYSQRLPAAKCFVSDIKKWTKNILNILLQLSVQDTKHAERCPPIST